ncbi:hypothetical protein [Mycobacterium sp. KBS0706]|uniref:hypothetical protein n=1 Tax=Mycobacterium sp. KBS0706 TaxID=2578109 RepID=UPI00163DAFCA|nr:hypothetical protein [Mycobacterium sp. KBS0706]
MSGFFESFLGQSGFLLGGAGGLVGGAALGGAGGGVGGGVAGSIVPGPGTAAGAIGGAGYGAWVGGAAGAVGGAAAGYGAGTAAGGWIDQTGPGQWVNQQVQDFQDWVYGDQAADKAKVDAASVTCATCAKNPCAELACGVPGSRYRGGAYGCVGQAENKTGGPGDIHAHHMPAKKYSPLNPAVGPAVQIDKADHYATASYGRKVDGPEYALQRAMLARGQVMQALLVDVAQLKAVAAGTGDPTKYDEGINQMLAYATCLKRHGIIQ